jgi:cell division protein FtsB
MLMGLQYQLWLGDGGILKTRELTRLVVAQQLENRQLSERNASLEAEVIDLKQGLEAIEERARSELGMIRAGETFIQVIEVP